MTDGFFQEMSDDSGPLCTQSASFCNNNWFQSCQSCINCIRHLDAFVMVCCYELFPLVLCAMPITFVIALYKALNKIIVG